MSHPAFDKLWDDAPGKDALDAAWDAPPAKTPAQARQAANETVRRPLSMPRFPEGDGASPFAHIANLAQGIPGMEAYEAASGALGLKVQNPKLSFGDAYRQSLGLLREETGKINPVVRGGEKIAGGGLLFPTELPFQTGGWGLNAPIMGRYGKASAVGAGLGGVDALLQADPSVGFLDRLKQAAVQAPIGGILAPAIHATLEGGQQLGKTIGGAIKASLPEWAGGAPSMGKQMQQLLAEKEATGAAYEHTLNTAGRATPQVEAFVREPDAAARIRALQTKEPNTQLSPTDPRMLDALYKSYSDGIKVLENDLTPLDKEQANTRAASLKDLRIKRARLLEAMSTPGEIPAVTQTLPGRSETMLGPMTGGQRGQVLPGRDEPVFGPASRGRPAQMSPPRTILTPEGKVMPVESEQTVLGPMSRGRPAQMAPGRTVINPRGQIEQLSPEMSVESIFGPVPRPEEQAGETAFQQATREALQRQAGRSAARAAGPVESQAIESALARGQQQLPPPVPGSSFLLQGQLPQVLHPEVPSRPAFVLHGQAPEVLNPEVPSRPGFVLRAQPPEVVREEIPAKPAFQLRGRAPETIETVPARQTPPMMPGYPVAVSEARRAASERDAFQLGIDMMKRAAKGGALSSEELATLSPEAVEKWAQTATPRERQLAEAALKGSIGKESAGTLGTLGGIGATALGAAAGGGAGGILGAAARMTPSVARANALREALNPTSPFAEQTFMRLLAALNAPGASQ